MEDADKTATVADFTFRQADELIKKPRKGKAATTGTDEQQDEHVNDREDELALAEIEGQTIVLTPEKGGACDKGNAPEPRSFGGNSPPDVAAETGNRFINAVKNWRRSDGDAARNAIKDMIAKLTELLNTPED